MKKYAKLPKYVGIRKNLKTGSYEASKRIKGKLFTKTFENLKKAIEWRNTYNPFDSEQIQSKKNLSFESLWDRYREFHFPKLELSSQGIKERKIKCFYKELSSLNVYDITPDFLELLISQKKKDAKVDPFSKRYNFDKTLDEVKAVFNWYKKNYDYTFHNPVLERHYVQGIIKKTVKKNKVLKQEQLISFFDSFDQQLYLDFAIIQFFCASRFGEIAGIQIKNVDLNNSSLLIKEVVVEDQSKRFLELKPYPKNGHPRAVSINSHLFKDAILRRLGCLLNGCNYLFHIDGKPLSYRKVQSQYNRALKKAGLFPEFSSTHILRYTMATESRRVMGTLDASQAVTGHKSIKMCEHYSKLPSKLQEDTIKEVGESLNKLLVSANSWDELGQKKSSQIGAF